MLHLITTAGALTLGRGGVITFCVLFVLITIGFYLLRSFGVYTLAKRTGITKPGLAFIPFFWIFTMAKLTKTEAFMGRKIKNFALIGAIIFTFAEVLALVQNVITYLPLVKYVLFDGGEAYYVMGRLADGSGLEQFVFNGSFYLPEGTQVITQSIVQTAKVLEILGWASLVFVFATVFIEISVYANFAKLYSPMHPFAVVVFSFLGLFPIIVFAMRKKNPVVIKRTNNPFMGANPYGNPYGNPYNNAYNNYDNASNQNVDKDPFEEYKKSTEDPFSDYSDKKEDK